MTAQSLIECINQFASQQSNPVLAVLPDDGLVEIKRKYPDPKLSFSGAGLRAYYHCHTAESRPDTEHGHFHIFLRTSKNQWSHLAGLSMDNMGQPLEWFTVNHWVSGETWNTAETLRGYLNKLLKNECPNLGLVEQWIHSMLGFYQQQLDDLLNERDKEIKTLTQERELNTILTDRTIYVLSQHKINLLSDLESYVNLNSKSNYQT